MGVVRGREKCVTGDVIERKGIDDYELSVSPSGWVEKKRWKNSKEKRVETAEIDGS